MGYTIDKGSDHQRINVKVNCILDQKIRKKILTHVAYFLNVFGYQRVQLDLTESLFKKGESLIGALELVRHMKAIGISPQTKLAFIFSEAEDHRNYFEDVARISGFSIRYFKDQRSASKWLNK